MLGSTRETSKKLSRTIVIKGARETISKRPQSLNVGQYQIISLQLSSTLSESLVPPNRIALRHFLDT